MSKSIYEQLREFAEEHQILLVPLPSALTASRTVREVPDMIVITDLRTKEDPTRPLVLRMLKERAPAGDFVITFDPTQMSFE